MATSLISIGSTNARSADIVVAAGESVTISLWTDEVNGLRSAVANVQIKRSDNVAYDTVGILSNADRAKVINAPGTYAVERPGGVRFAVDRS